MSSRSPLLLTMSAVRRFRRRHQATDLDEQLVHDRAQDFPYSDQALRLMSAADPPDDLAQQIMTWLPLRPQPVDRGRWAEAGRAGTEDVARSRSWPDSDSGLEAACDAQSVGDPTYRTIRGILVAGTDRESAAGRPVGDGGALRNCVTVHSPGWPALTTYRLTRGAEAAAVGTRTRVR